MRETKDYDKSLIRSRYDVISYGQMAKDTGNPGETPGRRQTADGSVSRYLTFKASILKRTNDYIPSHICPEASETHRAARPDT